MALLFQPGIEFWQLVVYNGNILSLIKRKLMETQIDKFGRVVIPKTVRDHLGLKTGSVLYIEEHNHDIVLKVAEHVQQIKMKNGIAVYMGRAVDDIESAISQERENRLDKLTE